MTAEEFNNEHFASFDIVDINLTDGNTRREILFQGHAYTGTPERVSYINKDIIPAQPPQVVILGDSPLGTAGIRLDEIASVDFISAI